MATIIWTEEKKIKVCEAIEAWMKKHGSPAYSGEGIMQDDDCQIHAPELIADLVDDIIQPDCSEDY